MFTTTSEVNRHRHASTRDAFLVESRLDNRTPTRLLSSDWEPTGKSLILADLIQRKVSVVDFQNHHRERRVVESAALLAAPMIDGVPTASHVAVFLLCCNQEVPHLTIPVPPLRMLVKQEQLRRI